MCDQSVALNGFCSARHYPEQLSRVVYRDCESGRKLTFLANHFALTPLTVCALYRSRWQVELFFRWIKQHLRIKRLYGTSENAVKTQIWIAVSVDVLVAIVAKRLALGVSLHALLQVLPVALFEKIPLQQALASTEAARSETMIRNQLILFES